MDSFPGWQWVQEYPVLGHVVLSDGACSADILRAKKACWKRFWIGAGSKRARQLDVRTRAADVDRCVWPGVSFRCPWWAFNKGVAMELDTTQRSMMAILLRVPRKPCEDVDAYFRRRAKEAGAIAKQQGLWSVRVAQRILSWDAHISRGSVSSWAALAYRWRDDLWYQARRLAMSSASVFGGRLGMRSQRGGVKTRFHDGVRFAKSHVKCTL